MEKKDLDAFLNQVSSFGEHYPDFFIAARTRDGELIWKTSDKTWGLGLCSRYINHVNSQDTHKMQQD